MVALSKFFDWRDALAIVKPETFVGWQRTAFKMFWRWKSRKPGRPALPKNVQELIGQRARENPTWFHPLILCFEQARAGLPGRADRPFLRFVHFSASAGYCT